MKVRCINNLGWVETDRKIIGIKLPDRNCDGPAYGDTLTVLNEYWEKGEKYYILLEWPCGKDGWAASGFKPIPEQYETVSFTVIKEKAGVN